MIVPVSEAQALANEVLEQRELPEEDAHTIADILIESELRGRTTHGLTRLPGIVERLLTGGRRPMRLAREAGSYGLIDGQGNLGYLVAHRCARTAVGKADGSGIGIVGAFNTGHCGMLGYYVSMIADTGMVGLMMCDTSPRIVPWGGTRPVLGSNPIAAAFPAGEGQILIDLSPASITNGQILLALKDGISIPEGCALGPDGTMTTDPEEASRGGVLPFGGHKGYALALMIQMFAGALVRGAAVPKPGQNYGMFLMALSPTIFLDREQFNESLQELIQTVKDGAPADGDEILIPGERSFRERERRRAEGIEINDLLWDELNRL